MSAPEVNSEVFNHRARRIWANWEKSKELEDVDALAIPYGKNHEEPMTIKTSSIHLWLFGWELTESVVVLLRKKLVFFSVNKKIAIIKTIKPDGIEIETIEKKKDALEESVETLFATIESEMGNKKIGIIKKDKHEGVLIDHWNKQVSKRSLEEVDISSFIQESMTIKDDEALANIRNAAKFTVKVQEVMIDRIELIIDEEKKIKHNDLSEKIFTITDNAKEMKRIEKAINVDPAWLDFAYSPIIQSGGVYDLRPQALSNEDVLSDDLIVCSVGCKYKHFNCNISRTLIIDPTASQEKNYKLLHECYNVAIKNIKIGTPLNSVYQAVQGHLAKKDSSLAGCLTNNIGFGIGLEFRETVLLINTKNSRKVEAGMTFNVAIGLNNIPYDGNLKKKLEGKTYSMMIADTVYINDKDEVDILTQKVAKDYPSISYNLDADEEEEEEEEDEGPRRGTAPSRGVVKESRLRGESQKNESNEKKRRAHQLEIMDDKQKELLDRLNRNQFTINKKKGPIKQLGKVRSYSSASEMPKNISLNEIQVDVKNDTVLMPMFGTIVPFHISMIKNLSKTDEGDLSFMRLNFFTPASITSSSQLAFPENKGPNVFYVKEFSIRSSNPAKLANCYRLTNELIKSLKMKEQEEKDKRDLVKQESLVLMKGKRLTLQDLNCRPHLTGRKTLGTLEAHTNGFRFVSNRNERIDIIYSNIKHAFFQPAENELIVLIHFHLYDPIMVGKKKIQDIQFFTEAGAQADDLDTKKRRLNDQDELHQEQRERQARQRLNEEFQKFIEAVENHAKDAIEFDVPYRDLGFFGVPGKSNVLLLPTVNCLVHLTEFPSFVLTLDEIEIAHFERVQHSLKSFDLVFIFKDYTRPVCRITGIPKEYLESVKDWLDSLNIIFSEGGMSMNWQAVMDEIRKDLRGFVEDGGWNFLQEHNDSDDSSEDLDEGDSEYGEEDMESDEASDSDFSEEEESAYSEEANESFQESEDEEEGLSWDELEEEMDRQDRQLDKRKRDVIPNPRDARRVKK